MFCKHFFIYELCWNNTYTFLHFLCFAYDPWIYKPRVSIWYLEQGWRVNESKLQMGKDNRRTIWQVLENEERGESSTARDKLEGKRPMFGPRGRPPVNNGGRTGETWGDDRDPPRDANGYALLTPKKFSIYSLRIIQVWKMLLTGTNFMYWSRSIHRVLGDRSKLELLDETLPEPNVCG